MVDFRDIKVKAGRFCQRGKDVIENAFIRRHVIPGGATLAKNCARAVKVLFETEGFRALSAEVFDDYESGILLQIGRKETGWKHMTAIVISGQDLAVNVKMVPKNANVELVIAGGRWIDKFFSGVLTWSVAFPLVAFPMFGVVRQRQLIDKVEFVILNWFEAHNCMETIDV